MRELGKTPSTGRRDVGFIAIATAIVFSLSGLALIGVSIASQRRAPQPPGAETGMGALLADGVRTSKAWMFTSVQTDGSDVVGPVLTSSRPVSLDIPSIDVRSDVQDLGQTSEGALQTPAPGPHYDEAAWYRHSPTPGSLGPAVMLGHVDSATEGPSVFFRLGELRRGERISVGRADGSTAEFVVDDVRSYAKDDFPTGTVYGDIDHAGLRIVTCGGAFDDSSGHYVDNVVVFASLVKRA